MKEYHNMHATSIKTTKMVYSVELQTRMLITNHNRLNSHDIVYTLVSGNLVPVRLLTLHYVEFLLAVSTACRQL